MPNSLPTISVTVRPSDVESVVAVEIRTLPNYELPGFPPPPREERHHWDVLASVLGLSGDTKKWAEQELRAGETVDLGTFVFSTLHIQ